jgi:hypothetical protein
MRGARFEVSETDLPEYVEDCRPCVMQRLGGSFAAGQMTVLGQSLRSKDKNWHMAVWKTWGNPPALRSHVVLLQNAMMRGSAKHELQSDKMCLIPIGLLKW